MDTPNTMKNTAVLRIVARCKTDGRKAKDIAAELKISGYQVFVASVCMCEKTAFFDTQNGLHFCQLA
jgi:hypothetical protein